ncbi:hypothetical protein ACFU93_37150 [Streptomyces sp. NPDC057611]|uniref:hypothetical protein n=1 Tax=Streptomyces sp. NPDC057611 TaxID=3346182 RepID=UPI0036BE56AB
MPIDVSASGPQAAEAAARIGDGLITMMPVTALVERFRRGGGGTNPVHGGLKVCWGTDKQEAVPTAHRLWATEQLPGELAQILPTPRHFEQVAQLVTEDQVTAAVPCGDDPEVHIEALHRGAERIRRGRIRCGARQPNRQGPAGLFDIYRTKITPGLRDRPCKGPDRDLCSALRTCRGPSSCGGHVSYGDAPQRLPPSAAPG